MSVPSANGWEGTCVIALSLGFLLLGYRTRFRLAGALITGRRQKLVSPAWQDQWQGQGGQLGNAHCCWRPSSSGTVGPWGQLARGGCAVPRLGITLDTCSVCLGRAQPPPLPSGLLPGARSSLLVPEPSPRLLRCPSSAAGTSERAGPTHEREMSSPTPCQEYLPAGCVRPWAWQVLHLLLLTYGSPNVHPAQPVTPSPPRASPWWLSLGSG